MSERRESQKVEETTMKPKIEAEMDTRKISDAVWQQIFRFLSMEDIKLNVARVCKHFYEISNDSVQEATIFF